METCKEQMGAQSYERHLGRFHPHEDAKDKRVFDEKKFTAKSIFAFKKTETQQTVKEDFNENILTEEEENTDQEAKRLKGDEDTSSSTSRGIPMVKIFFLLSIDKSKHTFDLQDRI